MNKRIYLIVSLVVLFIMAGVSVTYLFWLRPNQIAQQVQQNQTIPAPLAKTTPNKLSLEHQDDSFKTTMAANTIAVNLSKTYQTMLGFGGFIARFDEPHMFYGAERGDPKDTVPASEKVKILDDAFANLYLDSVTMSIGPRASKSYDWPSSWELENDDSDPQNINWSRLRFSTSYWGPMLKNVQEAKNRIETRGEKLTLIIKHSWGLEDWLTKKDKLNPAMEEEYAENITSFILWAKNNYNLEADYIVPMNEPDGAGEMSPDQYVRVIKYLGPMLKKYNLKTAVGAPETYLPEATPPYLKAIIADSQASQYVKLISFHGYDRDLSVNNNGNLAVRQEIAAYADQLKAQVLQGEYSACCKNEEKWKIYWNNTFTQGLAWAEDFYIDATVANAAGFDMQLPFWSVGDASSYVLMNFDKNKNYTGYKKAEFYYPLAQYINYIRSGMKRVSMESSDRNILTTGYIDEAKKQFVMVAINNGTEAKNMVIDFSGTGPLTLNKTRSSQNEQMVKLPNISPTTARGVYNDLMAPRSITTYFGNLPWNSTDDKNSISLIKR